MTGTYFRPILCPEEWSLLVASKEHWKPHGSAMMTAYRWQTSDQLPPRVASVLEGGDNRFKGSRVVFAFPEYEVDLEDGIRGPSHCDVWALMRHDAGIVSVAVEGKCLEAFGDNVKTWLAGKKGGSTEGRIQRRKRLDGLQKLLGVDAAKNLDDVPYQLFHRTAAAVLMAKKVGCPDALVLVHSFAKDEIESGRADRKKNATDHFTDYTAFTSLLGVSAARGVVQRAAKRADGINLWFAWVDDTRPDYKHGA
jgi:hypothetical protein